MLYWLLATSAALQVTCTVERSASVTVQPATAAIEGLPTGIRIDYYSVAGARNVAVKQQSDAPRPRVIVNGNYVTILF